MSCLRGTAAAIQCALRGGHNVNMAVDQGRGCRACEAQRQQYNLETIFAPEQKSRLFVAATVSTSLWIKDEDGVPARHSGSNTMRLFVAATMSTSPWMNDGDGEANEAPDTSWWG